eukprot:SAG22_NODE_958_length_6301_cov_4.995324_7_plen_57_part_00
MKTTTTLLAHKGAIWRPNMAGEVDALAEAPDDQSLGNCAGELYGTVFLLCFHCLSI